MTRKKVVTLNMSWEANNWGNAGPANPRLSDEQWRQVANSWNPSLYAYDTTKQNVFGPAYMNALRNIRNVQPDIILLQEFQIPTLVDDADRNRNEATVALIDVLNRNTKKYTVAAINMDVFTAQPAVACLVIVSGYTTATDISVDCRHAVNGISRAIYQLAPFEGGRPLAAAILEDGQGKTLIISSHSDHGVPWNHEVFSQTVLVTLFSTFSALDVSRTPQLIWGGDFNRELNVANATFNDRNVFAHKASNPTIHSKTQQVDWIMTTRVNPALVIEPLALITVASDHMLGVTTTSTYFGVPNRCN